MTELASQEAGGGAESPSADAASPAELQHHLRSLLSSLWIPHGLHALVTLGIPELLADGPRRASDLAREVGSDPAGLERLLRALVTIGVVGQGEDDHEFSLTPLGRLLTPGHPSSLRGSVLLVAGAPSIRSWSVFDECVRTGRTGVKILDDVDDPFSVFDADTARLDGFNSAMADGTARMAPQIAAAYDFDGLATVVDIGGGYATLLLAVLEANPALTGTVLDRPNCQQGAEKRIVAAGLSQRCRFVGGSFFEPGDIPAGADLYLMKSVIHDWDDERGIAILENCAAAMGPDSRLLLVEPIVPQRLEDRPEHRRIAWADMNMLVATGGRERTEADYRSLLDRAGLSLSRIVETDTTTSLIEASAAS